MEIVRAKKTTPRLIKRMDELVVGEVFLSTGTFASQTEEKLFLRTYSGVVNLEEPNKTWDAQQTCKFFNYIPVTAKVIIEENL